MNNFINGKEIAASIEEKLKLHTKNKSLRLAVILVGNHPPSLLYVNRKKETCERLGIACEIMQLADDICEDTLINTIHKLNQDASVTGILVQLPLPQHINTEYVMNAIDPLKDVDGLTITNQGRLFNNQACLIACTPKGCLTLIKSVLDDLTGLTAVIIGRSQLVGKPLGQLLLNENCTVIHAHSKTKNLRNLTKSADIVVCATGKPSSFDISFFNANATVIDVGIAKLPNGKTTGDVKQDEVANYVKYISPVPGGVGPMTIISLMENIVLAANMQENK